MQDEQRPRVAGAKYITDALEVYAYITRGSIVTLYCGLRMSTYATSHAIGMAEAI